MQQDLYDAIAKALEELRVTDSPFVVERPSDFSHGDYSTNAALVAAKQLGKSPREVSEELKKKLQSDGVVQSVFSGMIEKIEIAGPGFINFYLSHGAIEGEVQKAANNAWATILSDVEGKTIMVEYTDPNPFKEFHIGHLMSNTIGESIARILEHVGANVIRVNYQGDVGPHVAKALFVLLETDQLDPSVADISAAYVEGARMYEDDPAKKELIDQLNKRIYQQYDDVTDEKVWSLYQKGRKLTLEHFEELYYMLGTAFNVYFFESETGSLGLEVVRSHKDIFEPSEGAIVFHGENYGLHTRVFVNRLGLPTYETKDIGLAEAKKQTAAFDLSITITANEQDEYFKVIFKALELVHPDWAGQFQHISHGMMRFAEGKMSSRKGNVVTGESLLMDINDAAKEKMEGRELKDVEKTAQQIAVGAIKYAVLKQGSGKDIIFDPEKSLSIEGDSGPYLQYAHTRALSLLKAAHKAGVLGGLAFGTETGRSPAAAASQQGDAFADERPASAARSLLERTLLHFPEVVAHAAAELEPHYITTYLTELASLFNSWYANERVIGGENPEYGVLLTQAFANTMRSGLHLLGIPAPEEM